MKKSFDNGSTWTRPVHVDLPAFSDIPTPTTGPILNLFNNKLICQFETNKNYYDTTPWHHRSVLAFSEDKGLTWLQYRVVSEDPENRIFYWDQRPDLIGANHILNLFWTYSIIANQLSPGIRNLCRTHGLKCLLSQRAFRRWINLQIMK